MNTEVRIEVAKGAEDAYSGTALVIIPTRNIHCEFTFTIVSPADALNFSFIVGKGKYMFLMYRAGNPAQQQIDTYDEHQLPVFLLLFCPVLEAVKQVQLAFEGPVAEASPIASAIEEIAALGVGPLPTIVVNRTFVWKDTDKDIFEDLCRACSKVPTT